MPLRDKRQTAGLIVEMAVATTLRDGRLDDPPIKVISF
jgi:hypothetical protein